MTEGKIWFITGAGRGMGVDFAKAALAAGDAVVAPAAGTDRPGPCTGSTATSGSPESTPTRAVQAARRYCCLIRASLRGTYRAPAISKPWKRGLPKARKGLKLSLTPGASPLCGRRSGASKPSRHTLVKAARRAAPFDIRHDSHRRRYCDPPAAAAAAETSGSWPLPGRSASRRLWRARASSGSAPAALPRLGLRVNAVAVTCVAGVPGPPACGGPGGRSA
jgi:hypothetical protein